MTLARRMWLASAALALLVGAAFTALILAVSAQPEGHRPRDAVEGRERGVTAAGAGGGGRRVKFSRLRGRREQGNSLQAYREASGKLEGPARRT